MSFLKTTQIVGMGKYLPEKVVTNEDMTQWMDTSDQWIRERTGIRQRRWARKDQACSDLGLEAAKNALQDAGMRPEDLDMILFATLSPDHEFPGTACFFQAKLGAPNIPAIDIRQQCTGFVYGLSMADAFLKTGAYQTILLVGSELHSKGLDISTRGRDVAVLFGDGAGAVVLQAKKPIFVEHPNGLLTTKLFTDGRYAKELWIPAPGSAYDSIDVTEEMRAEKINFPKMNGRKVFVVAVKKMAEGLFAVLKDVQMKISDVDLFLFHQANLRIIDRLVADLSIPEEKVFNTIERYANTTAASIPLGLCEAREAGKLKPNQTVAIVAFGSGFTWAAALLKT